MTLMKGTNAVKAWGDMSNSERQQLRAQCGEHKGLALKDAMTAALSQKVIDKHEEYGGKTGEFRPIEYYKGLNYTQAMCDSILVNCKKAWDFQIGADTYALIVWGFGSKNTTATITEVLWSIPEKTEETTGANGGDNSKTKHIDSGSGSEESDDNSESKSSLKGRAKF